MRFSLACLLIILAAPLYGQESIFQITLDDQTTFEIWSPTRARTTRSYTAMILHPAAIEQNYLPIFYSAYRKVKDARVELKTPEGKKLETFKLKDFEDVSLDGTDISDNRVMYIKLPPLPPPFIIEARYEVEHKGTLFYPQWNPLQFEGQKVENASFAVRDYSGNGLRYRSEGLDEPARKTDSEGEYFEWKVSGLTAGEDRDAYPELYTAPNVFQMDEYRGDMSSWETFGDWIYDLNQDRKDLSEEQLEEVRVLTSGLETQKAKVQAVYHYLQKNIRYVSIQMDIGGWQPFPASWVHENKYGDCKALTLYTQNLLDGVGVSSYYTLVRAGADEKKIIREDFPVSGFNHVFLTVPMESDTVWLECTSTRAPFGYLGKFTSDRRVLLVNETGGHLIRSRAYTSEENQVLNRKTLHFSEEGNVRMQMERNYSGLELERDQFFGMYHAASREQEDWIREYWLDGDGKEVSWEFFELQEGAVPKSGFQLEAEIDQRKLYRSNRFFVNLSEWLDVLKWEVPDSGKFEVDYPFEMQDVIRFEFPKGYIPERLPEELQLQKGMITYERVLEQTDPHSLILIRRLKVEKGTVSEEQMTGFRTFLEKIRKADRERLVMRKGA